MELSYKAYNPYDGFPAEAIPGAFMNGQTETAWDVLQQKGFNDIKHFNYGIDTDENDNVSIIGHVIGHRNAEIVNNVSNDIEGGASNVSLASLYTNIYNDGTLVDNGKIIRNFPELVLNNSQIDLDTNSEFENNIQERPLVVLAVRGTVSCDEWKLDINEVIDIVPGGFATGKDIVMSTLYGRNIEKENCPYLV